MTARQIIQEIETLPPAEQQVVLLHLKEKAAEYAKSAAPTIRYADRDKAMAVADKIFTERAELFQKLAQ